MSESRSSGFLVHGPVIRHIRMMNGHGCNDLAKLVGCSTAYISQVERGVARRVSPAMFAKLRLALGVTDPRVLMRDPDAVDASDQDGDGQ